MTTQNLQLNQSTSEKDIKAIEGLNNHRSDPRYNGVKVNWQLCRLGGYCFNSGDHETEGSTKNYKSSDEELGEQEYYDKLAYNEGKTQRVFCRCRGVKPEDARIMYYKEKGRKIGTFGNGRCEKHSQEQAEIIIEDSKKTKGEEGVPLKHNPIGAVNFDEVNKKVEELTGKPIRN